MTKTTARVHSTPRRTASPTKPPEGPRDAFDQACGMEKPLEGIRNFAGALCRIAETLADDGGMIVYELALTIQARVQKLDNIHGYFFRLHHPERERFERDGWPDAPREAEVEAT